MFSGKHILIAPLDWGLGHATRCADLIQKLQFNNTITIGVTDLTKNYFERMFPDLPKVNLPSYHISYSKFIPAWLKVLVQTQKIRNVIAAETLAIKALQEHYKFDVIISDSRFGVFHPACTNYIVTHQLTIQSPIFASIANAINRNYLNKFDHILVPDFEDENKSLAGKLSRNNLFKNKVIYIGPLSHLNLSSSSEPLEKINCLVILSGPEPQRTVFEKQIINLLDRPELAVVLVRGSALKLTSECKYIKIRDEVYGDDLKKLMQAAEIIICRSGYSTLMDVHFLAPKKLILVPTPGQTEQEYLADYWQKKIGASHLQQHQLKSKLFNEIKTRLHLEQ